MPSHTQNALLFLLTLLAFVVESQTTQYVQSTLQYRQPFFLFYIVHSTFVVIFPLHLLYLNTLTAHSVPSLFQALATAVHNHFSSPSSSFPIHKLFYLVAALTAGVTVPSLLWFASISLASVSDITAIWNTNAFFAYLLAVKVFRLKYEARRLLAVSLATLGVVAVVYGGSSTLQQSSSEFAPASASPNSKPSAPLLGNLLTLVASFMYGLYQVLYKKYAVPPSDPEAMSEVIYNFILEEETSPRAFEHEDSVTTSVDSAAVCQRCLLPFGLYANLLTSAIGLITLLVLWVPIPVLHYFGLEIFRGPPNMSVALSIAGIALSGLVFNAGFMTLLGVWGPVVTSVGNLLTIVLVLISDIVFGSGKDSITFWGMLGSGVIVAAFGVLAHDMYIKGS